MGAITREEYAATVALVEAFLDGRQTTVERDLERRMREAAAELDYESAARYRNRLDAVRSILERQTIVSASGLDADAIGVFREETIAATHVVHVREGRVLGASEFVLDQGLDVSDAELVEAFLLRYYDDASHVPRQVLVACLPAEPEPLEAWLAQRRGRKVTIERPERGERKRLLEMATTNARHALARYKFRTRYDEDRVNQALLELESALGLAAPPLRIECYDISTLHGRFSVGSMIVFEAGRPDPSAYRRFRIRAETPESNDVAMMREVLQRRFVREAKEGARFARRPDLLIVDGGKPQLSAALAALEDIGVTGVPVVGAREARGGAVRAGLGRAGRAPGRLAVALPREARPRRGAPLRDHLPPRAARQGDDRLDPRRDPGRRADAQAGARQGVRLGEAPARRDRRADRRGEGRPAHVGGRHRRVPATLGRRSGEAGDARAARRPYGNATPRALLYSTALRVARRDRSRRGWSRWSGSSSARRSRRSACCWSPIWASSRSRASARAALSRGAPSASPACSPSCSVSSTPSSSRSCPLLTLPITILTLGLFALVVNLAMFYLAAAFTPISADAGFLSTALAAIIVAVFSGMAGALTKRDE